MQIGQYEYDIGRLNALDQLHVSRKIAPIVPTIMPILTELSKGGIHKLIAQLEQVEEGDTSQLENIELGGLSDALSPLMEAFASMPEDDVNYVIHKCLSVVKRDGALVCRGQSIMFDDLGMEHILPLTLAVIRQNLGNFIQGLLTKASSMKQAK